MKINQAFAILSAAGNPHLARIITENQSDMPRFSVWRAAHALRHGVPVAKIIHKKWFYGLPFYTNKYTLDPRPETETLVESVLHDWRNVCGARVLDLGTGTGCIGISLICNMKESSGVGVDISRRALRVAHKNACKMSICNDFDLIHGDFSRANIVGEQFDIVVSNPPYIAYGDKRVNSTAGFDPKIALYAKSDGLAAYEQIASNACRWIKRTGRLYVEIGAGMSRAVRSIFVAHGWKFVRADKDLAGKIRVLVFSL